MSVLDRLLDSMRAKDALRPDEIAVRLHVSEDEAEKYLKILVGAGRLSETNGMYKKKPVPRKKQPIQLRLNV